MQSSNSQDQRSKCKECKIFFANQTFNGFCSKCYKGAFSNDKVNELLQPKQSIIKETKENVQNSFEGEKKKDEKIQQKDKKKCFDCSKKVGLLGIECKCGYIYCNAHRLPEDHKCMFDHKAELNKKLKQTICKVEHGKIGEI